MKIETPQTPATKAKKVLKLEKSGSHKQPVTTHVKNLPGMIISKLAQKEYKTRHDG